MNASPCNNQNSNPEPGVDALYASGTRAGARALTVGCAALLLLSTLAGCSGMSQRGTDTAVGAGTGAVAGAILTGGSAVGTVGGAVVGGVIGDSVGKK